jgi:hypothetical protein
MAYSALIVESGTHPRKTASPEAREDRSGSPREQLAGLGLNRGSFYQVSLDPASAGARQDLGMRLLGKGSPACRTGEEHL